MKLSETEKRRLIVHARVNMKAQKRRNMGVINTCRVCVWSWGVVWQFTVERKKMR